jgi:hypothetical protein
MRQVVDTETALQFMTETLAVVDVEELRRIAGEVAAKAEWFGARLAPQAIAELDEAGFDDIVRRVFAARRNAAAIRARFAAGDLRGAIEELLRGGGDIGARFDAFVGRLDGVPDNVRADLASELLHFHQPERYWLWTRWMWDPRTRTGALPLVVSAAHDLTGDTPGEVYVKVGRGVAWVHEVGEAAGFQRIERSVFGTDVFLCCVYAIYAYTVLRMRMTKEFNKVMPQLAPFCRRLLGVYLPQPRAGAAARSQ